MASLHQLTVLNLQALPLLTFVRQPLHAISSQPQLITHESTVSVVMYGGVSLAVYINGIAGDAPLSVHG